MALETIAGLIVATIVGFAAAGSSGGSTSNGSTSGSNDSYDSCSGYDDNSDSFNADISNWSQGGIGTGGGL